MSPSSAPLGRVEAGFTLGNGSRQSIHSLGAYHRGVPIAESELRRLPGAEIVLAGLDDLAAGRDSVDAAAVLVAETRLGRAGIAVPGSATSEGEPGHRLYELLEADRDVLDPHSRYNAILRRIDGFARSLERAAPR